MPYAVTHIITGILGAELISKFITKTKIKFNYFVISGIAGLFPDIDVLLYPFARIASNSSFDSIHRHYTHNLILPFLFFIAAIILYRIKNEKFGTIALIFALGSFTHLILDALLLGYIGPFFPFSGLTIGLNLAAAFGNGVIVLASLDAAFLLGWLYVRERKLSNN